MLLLFALIDLVLYVRKAYRTERLLICWDSRIFIFVYLDKVVTTEHLVSRFLACNSNKHGAAKTRSTLFGKVTLQLQPSSIDNL